MAVFDKIKDIFKPNTQTTAQPTTQQAATKPTASSPWITFNRDPFGLASTGAAQPKTTTQPKATIQPAAKPHPNSVASLFQQRTNYTPGGTLSSRAYNRDVAAGHGLNQVSQPQRDYNLTYYKTIDDPTHTKIYTDLESLSTSFNKNDDWRKTFKEEYTKGHDLLEKELSDYKKTYGEGSNEYKALKQFVDDDYERLAIKVEHGYAKQQQKSYSDQLDQNISEIYGGLMSQPDFLKTAEEGKAALNKSVLQGYSTFATDYENASEMQKNLLGYLYIKNGKKGINQFLASGLGQLMTASSANSLYAETLANSSEGERGAVIGAQGVLKGLTGVAVDTKRFIQGLTGSDKDDPTDKDLGGGYTISDSTDDYLRATIQRNLEASGLSTAKFNYAAEQGLLALKLDSGSSGWVKDALKDASEYQQQILGYIYGMSGEEAAKETWEDIKAREQMIWDAAKKGSNRAAVNLDEMLVPMYDEYLGLGGTDLPGFFAEVGGGEGATLEQALHNASISAAEQIPAFALSSGVGNVLKAAGAAPKVAQTLARVAGAAPTAAMIGGRSYSEALDKGVSREKALGYGITEASLEFLTDQLLDGIGAMGGKLTGGLRDKAVAKISSPVLRALTDAGFRSWGEATQEYVQEALEPIVGSVFLGEGTLSDALGQTFDPRNILDPDRLYAGFLGGLTALGMSPGNIALDIHRDRYYAALGKGFNSIDGLGKIADVILNTPAKRDSGSYDEAKKTAEIIKKGDKISDLAAGKMIIDYADAGGDISFLGNLDTMVYTKEAITLDNLIAGAKSMLVELGGDAKLAEDIVKASRGEQISQETWRAIQADTNAMQVLTQLQGDLDMSKDTALSRAARASTRAGTGNQVYDTLKAENTDKTIATPAAQRLYEQNVEWDEAQQIGGLIDKVMSGVALTEDEAELISVGIPAVRSVIKEITGVELSESSTIGAVMTAMNDFAAQMAKTQEMQAAVKESTKQTARMPIPPAASGNSLGGVEISHDDFIQKYMARNEGVTLEEAEEAWNQRRMADAALSGEEENNGQQRTSHDQGRNDLGERRGGGENPSGTDQSGPATQPGRRGSDAAGSVATGVRGLRVSDGAVTTDGENADTLQDQYPDIVDLTDRLKKSGFTKITYVTKGNILNSLGQRVPGVCIGTELILSLDYKANGYSYVATAIHEEVHLKLNLLRRLAGEDEVNRFVSAALQSLLTKEQYTDAFRAYVKRYGPAYATYDSETRAYMINEEIFADMVAGVSNFGTTLGEFSEDAAAYMEDSNLNTVVQNLVDGLENPGEITNIEYVEGLPHEIPVDTLISDKNVDSPSTAPVDPGDTSRFAFFGLAEALGFTVDIEGKEKVYYGSEADAKAKRNGFTQVTVEQVANSPIGQLIQYSVENGYITKEDAKHELELFAAIGSITDKTRDFYMSMQFMGSTIFTAMKANSDKQYGTTYDFPSICTKTQAVVDSMSAQMVELGRALTEDEIKDTYNKVFNDGNPVTCPECYVFTRWVGIGGLLDHIKHYQDTYAAMTPAEVVKEYYTQLDALMQYAEANGLTKGKAKGSLASRLDKDMADLTEAIQTKENQGKSVPKKDYDRLRALESQATTINALSWLEKVYFGGKTPSAQNVNKNFVVPNDVLFDLNNGEAFARDYPGTWAFRTSQGAGYGKAIAPYAEATLGEGILVTANTTNAIKSKAEAGRAGRRMDNPFLTEKGSIKPNSKRGKKLESAIKKQLNQLFIGGQRFQSTSDARFDNAVDYLLAALEMQAMGGGAQVYTKVLGAVPFFEATGMCTNMSMMPYGGGLDTNNQPVDSKVGGVDPEVAQEMRLKNEHAGTITIGVNDAHIRAMFNQVFRDFIIPYHASGGKMSLIEYFRQVQDPSLKGVRIKSSDYTKTQSDRILSDEILRQDLGKSEHEVNNIHRFREMRLWILTGGKTGKMDLDILSTSTPGLTESQINARSVLQSLYASMQKGGKWHGVQLAKSKVEAQIFPNEFWDTNSTYETSDVNTQRYLDYCDALGFLHRFSGQTVARGKASDGTTRNVIKPVKGYDKNGEEIQLTDLAYKYDKDGNRTDEIEPFFWKTLTDRRMYGNDGQYLEQPRVTLANLNDETVTTFASPMGERRYDRKQSLKTAQELVAKRRAEGTMPKARLSIQDSTSVNDLTEAQQKNRDFNDSQTEVGSPLKTLQGTTIKRYKGIAGKEVSPQVYVHKDYAEQVVPAEALSRAEEVLSQEYPDFNYNTIMYDRKSGSIRFDEAPDFDSAREPIAGNTVTVYPDGRTKAGYSDSIWHHKWLWVGNDYDGFDVEDSWNWSKQWLNTIRPVDPSEHKFNSSFSQRGIANGTGHGTTNWNEQLEYFGLPTDGGPDVRASVADDTAPVAQQYSSEDTSINNNKLPSVFTNKWFTNQLEPGGTNIDIGGGKYDNATEYLNEEYDVTNMVFDPFNRDREHNSKVLDFITSGNKADTATCANVLNVINEAAARENVILECAKAIKPDGKAFFLIYEGDGTGNGRTTRTPVRNRDGTIAKDENGKTLYSTSWQEHRKAGTYVDEIKKYFDTVKPHGNLIEASDPKADLPKAAWEVTPGEAVRFSAADTENQNTSTNPYKEGTFEYTVYDMLGKINSPQELQDYINGLREKQQQDAEARNAEPGLFPKRKLPPVNEKEQQIRRAKLDELIEKYGAFKQGEKAARKYPIPEKVSETRRVNRGVRTAVEAKAIPDRLAERIGGEVLVNELLTYEPITDSDALSRGRSELARLGYEKALKEWESKSGTDRFPTKYDIAFGGLLLREAANNGDDAIALRIVADLAAMERQAGQVSQAGRLLKQLGPVGQLYYVKKAIDRLNHQNEGRIAKGSMQPIVIDPDLAEAVVTAKEQKDIDAAMDELIQSIADQLPVTMKDRWDAWRYLSMLGNPRTHIRNIAGNAIFTPVRFAKDLLAAAGESVFIKDESQRTKDARALFHDSKYRDVREFAEADYKEMEPYLTGTGKMNPLNEIMNKRKVLPGVLDKISRKNDDWLTGEDAHYLRKAYVSALTQFIAARGVSLEDLSADVEGAKILNEARKYAALEAQKATYRDFSQAAAKLNALKRGNSFASWLLDGVMPFTKTPINILKRGVEYSPIGLAKALTVDLNRVKKGDITAAEAIDHAAAGLTGTGVAVLGWLLASLGMARGGPDDDDKKDALEKAQGHQDYSLEIDGKSYTIDWMAPVALPFFVGVEAQKVTSGDGPSSFFDFVNAMMLISEPMTSLSMLEGINSTLSAVRQGEPSEAIMTVLTNAAANYLSQGVPTFAGQIARTADPYRRSTYVDKNSETPAWMQRFLQNVQGKVPGLADNKMAYVDTWGRKDTNESMFLRGIENFISPGYANKIHETPVDTELLRLYEATGDNSMLPGTVAKYFQVEGETLNLTADQYEEFKTVTGKTAFELIGELIGDVAYNGLSDADKSKAVQQALKIATAIGKQKVAPTYQTDGWIQRAIDHDNLETAAVYHTLEGLDTGLSNYQLISAMDWLTDDERGKLIVAEHPNTNRNMTDYTRKKHKFVLTDDQIKREREIYESLFWPEYAALLSNPKYINGDTTTRAELIKTMQSNVSTDARKALGNELRAAGYTSVLLDDSDVPDQVANLYDLLNRG